VQGHPHISGWAHHTAKSDTHSDTGHPHISGWAQAFITSTLHGKPHWQCTVLQARSQSPPRSPTPLHQHTHSLLATNSGQCHIQLPMTKHRIWQVQPHHSQSLPLRLVHSHGKCRPDRELQPAQSKRHACVRGCDSQAWYAHNVALCRTSGNLCLNDTLPQPFDNQASAVGKATSEVAQQNYRAPVRAMCRWQSCWLPQERSSMRWG
jgi:hypothetical protein